MNQQAPEQTYPDIPDPIPAAEFLPDLTSRGFTQRVLDIYNELSGAYEVDFRTRIIKFVEYSTGRVVHAFPHPLHRSELVDFAVERAVECDDPKHGVIVLTNAIGAIHGLRDYNGRTARRWFTDSMGLEPFEEDAQDKNRTHANLPARAKLDMKRDDEKSPPYSSEITRLVYGYVDLEYVEQPGLHISSLRETDASSLALPAATLAGLGRKDRQALLNGINLEGGRHFATLDLDSTLFSIARFKQRNPTQVVPRTQNNDAKIDELLLQLTPQQKRDFADDAWLYRALRAQAEIDSFSDQAGGKMVTVPKRGEVPLRELALRSVNLPVPAEVFL